MEQFSWGVIVIKCLFFQRKRELCPKKVLDVFFRCFSSLSPLSLCVERNFLLTLTSKLLTELLAFLELSSREQQEYHPTFSLTRIFFPFVAYAAFIALRLCSCRFCLAITTGAYFSGWRTRGWALSEVLSEENNNDDGFLTPGTNRKRQRREPQNMRMNG